MKIAFTKYLSVAAVPAIITSASLANMATASSKGGAAASSCWVRQELSARGTGFINKVLVRDGQKVRKGEVVIELDNRLLQAGLKEAEAGLTAAKNNELLAADAVSRMSQLKGSDSVAEQQVFEARIKQSQARAAKMQAEAVVQRIKTQLDDTYLRAEVAGVVRGVPNVLGMFVQPGQSLGRIDVGENGCADTPTESNLK